MYVCMYRYIRIYSSDEDLYFNLRVILKEFDPERSHTAWFRVVSYRLPGLAQCSAEFQKVAYRFWYMQDLNIVACNCCPARHVAPYCASKCKGALLDDLLAFTYS